MQSLPHLFWGADAMRIYFNEITTIPLADNDKSLNYQSSNLVRLGSLNTYTQFFIKGWSGVTTACMNWMFSLLEAVGIDDVFIYIHTIITLSMLVEAVTHHKSLVVSSPAKLHQLQNYRHWQVLLPQSKLKH